MKMKMKIHTHYAGEIGNVEEDVGNSGENCFKLHEFIIRQLWRLASRVIYERLSILHISEKENHKISKEECFSNLVDS